MSLQIHTSGVHSGEQAAGKAIAGCKQAWQGVAATGVGAATVGLGQVDLLGSLAGLGQRAGAVGGSSCWGKHWEGLPVLVVVVGAKLPAGVGGRGVGLHGVELVGQHDFEGVWLHGVEGE